MFTCEIILLSALLSVPDNPPLSLSTQAYLELTRPAIVAIGLDAELFDPREVTGPTPHFSGDIATLFDALRQRQSELNGAPLLGELSRFPNKAVVATMLVINRGHRNALAQRLEVDAFHAEVIQDAICDADQVYRLLDQLRDADAPHYYVSVRRQSLMTMRQMLGDEWFYAGRLPSPIPTGR